MNMLYNLLADILNTSIMQHIFKPAKSKKRNVVYVKRILVFIGLFAAIIFPLPVVLKLTNDEPIQIKLIFILLGVLGLVVALLSLYIRIKYDDNGIYARGFFIKNYKFKYRDITRVWEFNDRTEIHFGKHVLNLVGAFAGRDEFVAFVKYKRKQLSEKIN